MAKRRKFSKEGLKIYKNCFFGFSYCRKPMAIGMAGLLKDIFLEYSFEDVFFQKIEFSELHEVLFELMRTEVTEKEMYVVVRYYNLDGCGFMNLREIGEDCGRTETAVRVNRKRALEKISSQYCKRKILNIIR